MVEKLIPALGVFIGGAVVAGNALRKKLKRSKAPENEPSPCSPSVLVCGATGSGKSSLVNDITGKELADTSGSPTMASVLGFDIGTGVMLFDAEGYTVDNVDRYLLKLGCFFRENRCASVWYCVNAGSKRFTETDRQCADELIRLAGRENVSFVLTKADEAAFNELTALHRTIAQHYPDIRVYSYSVRNHEGELYSVMLRPDREELRRKLNINTEDSHG